MSTPKLLDGKYEKHEVIGNGSYGKIYSATDKTTGQSVALKRFKERIRSPEAHQAIIDEINIHKELDHPRILRLFHSFEDEKKDIFAVMEMMASDLATVLRGTKTAIPLPVRKAYMIQILEAIDYLHTHGILHRVCQLYYCF